ncbi:P-loop containing nucleoside triphosphate hydrolase protein [Dendrothele bispora CBS 962.96]|uniref:DNA 3'-5' helicase n=1 Tax=Dendrothele bispora (strain CBS 962.96) TaxID=1314807 RepID=A0A4S8L079_DENBC|nr:P-loop containing nucleoside triphosphate hydrolase protein [Dendrothele bispora CBS 962.96]
MVPQSLQTSTNPNTTSSRENLSPKSSTYESFFSFTQPQYPNSHSTNLPLLSELSHAHPDQHDRELSITSPDSCNSEQAIKKKKTRKPDTLEQTCKTYSQHIKSLDESTLAVIANTDIPAYLFPRKYIESLSCSSTRSLCYQLCLVCWQITKRTQCPKPLQLKFACAIRTKRDVFMNVGTGFGKTLPSVLPQLVAEGNFATIIISPLKRLQSSQANALREKYGLCVVVVNEDSPKDDNYWKIHAYDFRMKTSGCADIFIVTPEQFFEAKEGYPTIFSKIVRNSAFNRRIGLISVDDAHFVHVHGLEHHGISAFRPGYGDLAGIKNLFGPNVPWAALTATATHQVLQTLEKRILRPGYITLHATSNRPNIMFATHCVPGRISDPRNYTCFLSAPFNFTTQDDCLPPEYRGLGVVMNYDSLMSDRFLERAHSELTKPNGICKILVATAAAESTGIDHPDVEIVCIAGLPSDVHDIAQQGGRAVRQISGDGLCILFHEKWALDVDLADYSVDPDNISLDSIDFESFNIDRPRKLVLNDRSPPVDRDSFACIVLTRNLFCACRFMSQCLQDNTPEAVEFSTPFCCSGHSTKFNLQNFLPGPLYNPTSEKIPDAVASASSKPKSRSSKMQHLLERRLKAWRLRMHRARPWPPRPLYYILPDSHIQILASSLPHSIRTRHDVVALVGQTVEWGQCWSESLCKLVMDFDCTEEKVRSPEFIDESDCNDDQWEMTLLQEHETRKRTEGLAIEAMGSLGYEKTKKLLDKHRRQQVFTDITNM